MPRFNSPAAVQEHFYRAIESGDVKAMMQAWSEDTPVICIHPGAPLLSGLEEISLSWKNILSGDANLRFKLSDEHFIEQSRLAVYTTRVEVHLDNEWVDTLLTTNVYQHSDSGWHLISHHASPDPSFDTEADFDETGGFDDTSDYGESNDMVLH